MGKKFVITVVLVLLFLSSCQTNKPQIWDDSYPEEKLTEIRFLNFDVDSYNGISVTKFYWVKVPAGDITFGGKAYMVHSDIRFSADGMEFSGHFEEGKAYTIYGGQNDMRWGVFIYDGTDYSRIKDENLVAFIPFKEQPVFIK